MYRHKPTAEIEVDGVVGKYMHAVSIIHASNYKLTQLEVYLIYPFPICQLLYVENNI